jgi:proteasome accessory factor A
MELIRCYEKEEFVARWDYSLENPRLDMRGFEVEKLRNDQDELEHLQADRKKKIPIKDLKSDLLICNGARLYNDHTHPEFSTPECRDLFQLVAYDRAGERILSHCADLRSKFLGDGRVRLYKNNTDFHGHSYGTHENFLVQRSIDFDLVVSALIPFIVTRQIYAGAGKVGFEEGVGDESTIYQISQRADFFEAICNVDTMQNRPLVNSRDEPHANSEFWRRLHVIIGDANMCEWATAVKVGSLSLVIDLLEDGSVPLLKCEDPVSALKSISTDSSYSWPVLMQDGQYYSAIDIQSFYLDAAKSEYAGRDNETDWLLSEWNRALDALGNDHRSLIGFCDWITKKWLLDQFAEAEGLDWERREDLTWLQSQDLQYHNIDPEEGLSSILESEEKIHRLVSEKDVEYAMDSPPSDTRAYFRGCFVSRFSSYIRSLNWDMIEFEVDGKVLSIDLKNCISAESALEYRSAIDSAIDINDLLEKIDSLGRDGIVKGEDLK